MNIKTLCRLTAQASTQLAAANSDIKNNALKAIAEALQQNTGKIEQANRLDLKIASENNLAEQLIKRLKYDNSKIQQSCLGLESLIEIPDPVWKTLNAMEMDNALELYKLSCPIGVIGVIFESRPDALVQIASLCLKSSNAVILKGGSEAANTNKILAEIITHAAAKASIPDNWLVLLETRQDVAEMLKQDDYINLIVPRGSNEFVKYIMDNTTIPVMGHANGICHVYIDDHADIQTAVKIAVDSKCQYPAVCNAMETLLVNESVAGKFLPVLKNAMDSHSVEIRGCTKTVEIINVKQADEKDFVTEYLDLILSIKIVPDIDQAIEHINNFGSGHTDAIVTSNKANAMKFARHVDSADVFINCSTRFSDGYRFGLGAELGISTSKIHARGPVGIEGLLTYKWILKGSGNIVADYADSKTKLFTHKIIRKEFGL